MDVVIYARISSESQSVASIEAQLFECNHHAKNNGYTVVREFIERGESARSADRPEFQDMIKLVSSGLADAVLVHKFDRFSRNREDSVIYKALLRRNNKQVISVTQPVEDSPMGYLMEGIFETLDAFYSLNLATETRKGKRQRARDGYWINKAPLGYELREGILYPTEKKAQGVQTGFVEYATGKYSLKTWADEAWERGITSNLGRKIPGSHWGTIFRRVVYRGLTVHNGDTFPGKHVALIDAETFEAVQTMLSQRSRGGAAGTREFYLLRKLLWSEVHQRPMQGNTVRNGRGNKYYYYRAVGRGPEHNISAPMAEQLVSDLLWGVRILEPEHIPADEGLRLALRVAPSAGHIYRQLNKQQERRNFMQLVFPPGGLRVSQENAVYIRIINRGWVWLIDEEAKRGTTI